MSPRDHGSLNQLFTRLGWLPKANKPKDDMHACQDALLTVFKGHIAAAACRELNIGGPEGDIKDIVINKSLLEDLAVKVARRFTVIPEAFLSESVPDTGDQVHSPLPHCSYSLSLHRCLQGRRWRTSHQVLEAVYAPLPCREEDEIHVGGSPTTIPTCHSPAISRAPADLGTVCEYPWWQRLKNKSCDLHNEHVNKLYKEIIGNMGAKFTEFASTRAARAVPSLERLALGFERQTGIHPEATAHSRRSDAKDVQIVVQVVLKARILEVIDDRCHSKFPNFSSYPLHRFDRDRVIIWIKKKAKQHSKIVIHNQLTLQIVLMRMRMRKIVQ